MYIYHNCGRAFKDSHPHIYPDFRYESRITMDGDDVPHHYRPDSQLRIQLECADAHGAGAGVGAGGGATTVTVSVVQAFVPFTTSQVLLVRLEEKEQVGSGGPQLPPLGELLIAKVYDPRYVHHRVVFGKPWTYEAEAAAARRRSEAPGRGHSGSHSDVEQQTPRAPQDTSDEIAWEEFYFAQSLKMCTNEVRAYRRLRRMQDVAVPRMYGVGTLDLAHPHPHPHPHASHHLPQQAQQGGLQARAVAPPVLLLQYIADARSLEDLDALLVNQALLESALESVQQFTVLGVIHGDLNGSEILCYPAERPVHAFVIDFGNARTRAEGESEEDWAEAVVEAGNVRWVEMLFHLHAQRGAPH